MGTAAAVISARSLAPMRQPGKGHGVALSLLSDFVLP